MNRPAASDLRLLFFYAIFTSAAGLLLAGPEPVPIGWRLFAGGVLFNLALPLFAATCVEPRWIRIWSFLLPLSLLQVVPDAHLAANLGTLHFPDLGFPKIGPVSGFMALLWIIPLFVVVYAGERVAEIKSPRAAAWTSALVALALFAAAEATLTLVPVWQAVDVRTLGPVALYVLLPEALLGLCAWWLYRWSESRPIPWKLACAVATAALYTAALHVSHLVFEVWPG